MTAETATVLGTFSMPLAALELRRAANRKWTYAARAVGVGVSLPFLAFACLMAMTQAGSPWGGAERLGAQIEGTATALHIAVVFLVVPLLTAPLVAREKQEHTLGLLLLADLHGWDVYVAKFLSACLQAQLLLLGTLPLLSFAGFFGGVSVPAMALRVFLFGVAAVFACALGLLCSTLARSPGGALVGTVSGLILWEVFWAWLPMFGVVPAFRGSVVSCALATGGFLGTGLAWVPGAAIALVAAAGMAAAALLQIPRQALERPRRIRLRKRRLRRRPPKDPVATFVARNARGFSGSIRSPVVRWLAAAALVLLATVGGSCLCLGPILVTALLFYDVTSSMAYARSVGALDDLLVTPLERDELARTIFRGHFRNTWIFLPACSMNGVVLMLPFAYGSALWRAFASTSPSISAVEIVLGVLVLLAVTLFLVVGGVWAAFLYWLAVSLRSESARRLVRSPG